ncbi:hypothetical protein [Klebsiella pneumoniae ISC21]|nr:hypothetical protein [Klebsiella pneumoniae ISC21]
MEADKTCGTSDQKLHIFPPGCGYPVLHKCRFYTGLRLGSLALPRLTRQARGEGRFFQEKQRWQRLINNNISHLTVSLRIITL